MVTSFSHLDRNVILKNYFVKVFLFELWVSLNKSGTVSFNINNKQNKKMKIRNFELFLLIFN
jgi:hypothetical protein